MEEYEKINQDQKRGKNFSNGKKIIFGLIPFIALAGMIILITS